MKFEKWEGLGNDFIVVNEDVTAEQAVAWCDRRRGVGADGILVVRAASMRVVNADGSQPEMCGNGLRCAAAYFAERGELAFGAAAEIHTDAGARPCTVTRLDDHTFSALVGMGPATLGVPFTAHGRSFVPVGVGNPHAVSFDDFNDADLDHVGAAVEQGTPGGTNVEFARVRSDGGIDVIVWERGVGRTDACGTGACAVAAAAVHKGLIGVGDPVAIHLPGGSLTITVLSGDIMMEGPARRVFRGDL